MVVTSASKSWNLAGMKAAVIIAGPSAHSTLRRLPAIVKESASWFGVLAHSTALSAGRDWLAEVSAEITENKHLLARQLREQLGLPHQPSDTTYLEWVDCSPLGLDNPGRHFHEKGRVRFNLGTEFDQDATQYVRINVATSKELINEGVHRMATSLDDLA